MNIKKMKVFCASSLIFSLCLTVFAPIAQVGATNIGTSLTRSEGSGENPIVEAKWEANIDKYTDASTAAGAQFDPTGVYQSNKTIAICAIVTDPDDLDDINHVYADVYYPTGVAVGEHHVKLADQDGSVEAGCGLLMQQDTLTRLPKLEGYNLFCDSVKNHNNNLPTFGQGYDYAGICAEQTGDLMKEDAAVYCTAKELSYEDPSGDYRTLILAQDKVGRDGMLDNHFTYREMTAFETDFSKIDYGTVKLNTERKVNGDLTWDGMDQGPASVRNVGNTRLFMKVWQDAMGLGTSSGQWNVKYGGKIGSNVDFARYYPEVTKQLEEGLDLSEMNEMDFLVEIFKFPPETGSTSFTGSMVLSAKKADHLLCGEPTN